MTMMEQYSFYPTSEECEILSHKDPRLGEAIALVGELNYQLHPNNESFFIETIIGQMMSNSVADKITARLQSLCGEEISAQAILDLGIEPIRGVGISMQKAEYIMLFSEMMSKNPNYLNDLTKLPDDAIIRELTSLRGIGNWTAKMYLIFVLNRFDVVPYEDGAFMQSYRWLYRPRKLDGASIMKRCRKWHPYESLAARYLYRVLDYGMTKYQNIQDAQEKWHRP